jgi:putative ABC transport system substrate-binding protein
MGAMVTALGFPALAAQEPGRIYRIGILSNYTREAPIWVTLFTELTKFGLVQGGNLVVDPRGFAIDVERVGATAAELLKSGVEVIICGGKPMTAAVQAQTSRIPILSVSDDMIAEGLVPSLARPGGNLTGISILASELNGKRQEMLIDLAPGSRFMVALVDPGTATAVQLEAVISAAAARGVKLSAFDATNAQDIAAAIERSQSAGAGALNVLASPLLNRYRGLIIEQCAARRLPAIYQWPETAEEGGLLAYGPRFTGIYRQLAAQLAKLLRGEKAADLPVEQPTKFELVVNLNTAKALGLTVPQAILARADEVIE